MDQGQRAMDMKRAEGQEKTRFNFLNFPAIIAV
jgi:hypothetical protein